MKISRAVLVVMLMLMMTATTLFAGGQKEAAATGDEPLRVAVVMPSSITDVAFSQSMYDALIKVQEKLGGPSAMEIVYSENMFNVPDAASAMRDYASQGYDIVFGHGSQYGSSIQEIAPDFPDVVFPWGTDVNTFGLDNVYAYTAAAEQGGYVNGVLAAHMAKANGANRVGVTGPIEVGDAKTYIDGFVHGVASVDKGINVSKTWTGSFSDVAAMTAAAQAHVANGAVALTGSSQSVVGSIGVCKDAGDVYWFGTQADQTDLAPSIVVASQVYDWVGMIEMILDNKASGKMGGDAYILTLKNEGLKMAYNPDFPLPAEARAAADAAVKGIIDGSIKAMP